MPIRFHCHACSQLLSISRSKAGEPVTCPTCGESTVVPHENEPPPETIDIDEPEAAPAPAPMQFDAWNETPETEFDPVPPSPEIAEPAPSAELKPPVAVLAATVPVRDDDDPPEFRMRKAQTEFEEMDLTPMVDVTFLLLIFFMLTASFSLQKTIPTPVPESNEQSASQPIQPQEELLEKSILIEIDDTNTIFLDETEIANPRDLTGLLREAMNRDQKAEVLVDASENAFNETVVFVLDAANEVGMQRIRMTFPKAAPGGN